MANVNENKLICIYDDKKEDLKNLLLEIYTNFLEEELRKS